jgi:hypothetical protein
LSDLARRIDNMSPEERVALEQRLLRRRSRQVDDVIPRRDPDQPCPLSFSQQRLWFLDQLNPGGHTYNAAVAMRIRGRLDVGALHSALETVVERHEALRTVFRVRDGEPVQVVLGEWSLELPVVDLGDNAAGSEGLHRLMVESARRPFDLANDLMLRAALFRIGDEDHALSLEEHHIAFDGWSDVIMFREVAEVYSAALAGREPELPELPIQYADFAVWQRQRLRGSLLAELQSYWQQQLAAAPNMLRLPTDLPRPAVQTFSGAHHHFSLPGDLADGVRRLSRAEGVTPYMTLLGCFAALVYRFSGQDDVLIGSPIANRSRMEVESIIGFFSNTLCMRLRLGGNPTFREVISRVREVTLGAYTHQELPFEKVVEAVRPARDPRVNPLFQINFRATTGPATTLALPGLEIAPLQLDLGFSRFDLALELQVRDDALEGYLEYNTNLFREETAVRLTENLEALLQQVTERPDAPLLELELPNDMTPRAAKTSAASPIAGVRRQTVPVATGVPNKANE